MRFFHLNYREIRLIIGLSLFWFCWFNFIRTSVNHLIKFWHTLMISLRLAATFTVHLYWNLLTSDTTFTICLSRSLHRDPQVPKWRRSITCSRLFTLSCVHLFWILLRLLFMLQFYFLQTAWFQINARRHHFNSLFIFDFNFWLGIYTTLNIKFLPRQLWTNFFELLLLFGFDKSCSNLFFISLSFTFIRSLRTKERNASIWALHFRGKDYFRQFYCYYRLRFFRHIFLLNANFKI